MDAHGDMAFNISQSLANLVSNDSCPAGAGQKRLSDHDGQCLTNSAQFGLNYAASSGSDLQGSLLRFPTDFSSPRGPLATAMRSIAVFFQNPPLFDPNVFSGARKLVTNGPYIARPFL